MFKKKPNPPGYMTTLGERKSYWWYFVGQNAYHYISATFLSTYLAMQGVDLTKIALIQVMRAAYVLAVIPPLITVFIKFFN